MRTDRKAFYASVLFLTAAAGALLAAAVRKKGGGLVIPLAEAFAGGTLLAAGLVHLLADAEEQLAEHGAGEPGDGPRYPWPALLCGVGALCTHGLEESAMALWIAARRAARTAGRRGRRRPEEARRLPQAGAPPQRLGAGTETPPSAHSPSCTRGPSHWDEEISISCFDDESDAEHEAGLSDRRSSVGFLAGPLLMLALTVHSILEGMSLGAINPSGATGVFLAILAHKGVAAFALGIAWLSGGGGLRPYACAMAVFASATPIGVAIGVAVEGSVIGGIVAALSAGTFLYIGLVEGCPGIRVPWLPTWFGALLQGLVFGAGFGCMAAFATWA